jgi:adenosine deaminase
LTTVNRLTTVRDLTLLPKAHLHVHVEGAIRWSTLHEIADANGVAPPVAPEGDRLGFSTFGPFAEHNGRVRDCLRRPEDFTRIAREFCADEAAQGTGYAEVTFTAASHGERLGDPDMPLLALLRGLAEGQAAHGIECRVLLDHPRRRPVGRLRHTLDLAIRHADDGVVGIGLAGAEGHPVLPFAQVFADAVTAGVRLVHHAGEQCGPDSIRDALTIGRADRIGHGIRILDDPDLVARVRERGTPLEVCPSSNVALGVVPSLAEHPLPRLRDAGLTVTVNADVPTSIGTTLTDEYARIRDAFGYDDTVLAQLARASVDASFAPAATKRRLHDGITSWLA